MNELINKLNEMSDAFKVQTQEQYSNGTLSKRIEEEIFPLAYKVGGETWKQINTIWYSSQMASKEMVSLALEMLASLLYINENNVAKTKVSEDVYVINVYDRGATEPRLTEVHKNKDKAHKVKCDLSANEQNFMVVMQKVGVSK